MPQYHRFARGRQDGGSAPCPHLFGNYDGYGQRKDGGPYQGWQYGHAWPVLTGERGHYELAAGRDVRPFIRAMESFATSTQLLPEQVWALPDQPKGHMSFGRPTGGAMPLVWAHAEYIQLVRSAADGQVFGLISEVADRYRNRRAALGNLEIQPAGALAPYWGHLADPGGVPVPVAQDLRRMEASP